MFFYATRMNPLHLLREIFTPQHATRDKQPFLLVAKQTQYPVSQFIGLAASLAEPSTFGEVGRD